MYFDTHTHLNLSAFKNDTDEVIRRSLSSGVWMIIVGIDYKSSRRALDLANKYERGVYAAVGLHPNSILFSEQEELNPDKEYFNFDAYAKLTDFEKAVAIGEIGLDYYHLPQDGSRLERQKRQAEIFYQQLLLARQRNLPAIIHCRDAHSDMIEILHDFRRAHRNLFAGNQPWAVIHCFSGDEDLAWQYFNLGVLISFTATIMYNSDLDNFLRKVPLDKIMLETDCPFLPPPARRGRRNDPTSVILLAQHLAKLKDITEAEVAEKTNQTAIRFFRLK
ncbi:TatD family deoxyribonuclease [Candidatus Parcubacteria bacterium]|nr:MAG: TatD family deoxyribonuclease [Candidatus Parcubacteria bacterium]